MSDQTDRKGKCSLDGCDRNRYARDLCAGHYRRQKLYGDPLKGAGVGSRRPEYDQDYILSEIEWLREGGMTAFQISEALNFRPTTLERLMHRWRQPELAGFFHVDAA